MAENYFDLPEVSSSDLGALERTFYGADDNRDALKGTFNFGSLVDAMLTETRKLDFVMHTLTEEGGEVIEFDVKVWRDAERLASALRKDPLVSLMLAVMVGQYIFRRTLTFNYEGEEYTIRGRCKFDGYYHHLGIGLDYKTTACKTLKEFRASIDHFNYDRQAAWYMDLTGINQHWIIGISKVTGEIFKHVVARGDETHRRGVEKYSLWAYRWIILIGGFTSKLLTK